MGFTPISVQAHRFNPDGSAATGSMTFSLNSVMKNGFDIVEDSSVQGSLTNPPETMLGLPGFALTILAVDDDGTTPTGPTASYTVTESINGMRPAPTPYDVYILHDATIEDLAAISDGSGLITLSNVQAASSMVGRAYTSAGGNGTVTAFNASANTINITPSPTAGTTTATIGGAVDLSTLTTYDPAPSTGTYIPWNLPGGNVEGDAAIWNGTEWVPGSAGGGSSSFFDISASFNVGDNGQASSLLGMAADDVLENVSGTLIDAMFWSTTLSSLPVNVEAGGGVVFDSSFGVSNIDTTLDIYNLFAAIVITDIDGTNLMVVACTGTVPQVGPAQTFGLDWSTATVDISTGSDLSWENGAHGWGVYSADGGIYFAQCLVQGEWN